VPITSGLNFFNVAANCGTLDARKEIILKSTNLKLSAMQKTGSSGLRKTLFCGGNPMEYRGVEYSVIQLTQDRVWRWEVKLGGGKNKSGLTSMSRAAAIKLAEYEIDRALKDRE
jgi:hypothetical protein